jgi:hypothetical protein
MTGMRVWVCVYVHTHTHTNTNTHTHTHTYTQHQPAACGGQEAGRALPDHARTAGAALVVSRTFANVRNASPGVN